MAPAHKTKASAGEPMRYFLLCHLKISHIQAMGKRQPMRYFLLCAGKEFDRRIAAASRLAPQNSAPAPGFFYLPAAKIAQPRKPKPQLLTTAGEYKQIVPYI